MRAALREKHDDVECAAHIDATQFRRAFSNLASGVVVITFDMGRLVYGFTATSLTPVSLDPPLALFCVKQDSACGKSLEQNMRVGISILGVHQADIARTFARPTPEHGYDGLPFFAGVPVVGGANVTLLAQITALHPAGDHMICVCAVECAATTKNSDPLIYYDKDYQSIHRRLDVST